MKKFTTSLSPLALGTQEVIHVLGSQKLFRRSLHAGWISPRFGGGKGRRSLFDYEEVRHLWARIKAGEKPPLLPCELTMKGGK